MRVLLDTNILLRFANVFDTQHAVSANALAKLHRAGDELFLAPQNFIEFRSVATRPAGVNGLGLSPQQVEATIALYEQRFAFLPDTADIYPAWKAIVQAAGVIGKQVHDARLIAVCQVHQVTHLLSFNVGHFARLAATAAPPVQVIDPRTV